MAAPSKAISTSRARPVLTDFSVLPVCVCVCVCMTSKTEEEGLSLGATKAKHAARALCAMACMHMAQATGYWCCQ